MTITASIGIALRTARRTAEELLRDADIAMYRAKDAGRDRFDVFDRRCRQRSQDRLELEMDLVDAIEHGRALPASTSRRFDLRTGEISGVEALVRWQHPERGVVGPGRFIPIAEETGLIVPIGALGAARGVPPGRRVARAGSPARRRGQRLGAPARHATVVDDVDARSRADGLAPELR